LSGEGEKWAENGRRLPASRRTSISFSGRIEGHQVRLDFTEYGTERTSEGRITLSVPREGNELEGRFMSDAAGSSGYSTARRVF
jgi:hypothetical protein